MLFRRRTTLSDPGRVALARILASPTFELIPLRNALDEAAHLPPGATVSVTASPARGLDATLGLAGSLARAGFMSVPHVAARMVRDRHHLRDILARLDGSGVSRMFVVAGDAKAAGGYPDGLSLLMAMAETDHRVDEIGLPAYPQGHAFIGDDELLGALRAKAGLASYMTTQLCFDPAVIGSWLAARRAEGLRLPVHIGVPGLAEPGRLLAIAARIGVADTQRYLSGNLRFVTRLIRSGGFYRPDALVGGIAQVAADPQADVTAIHLYTFNAVRETERWRARFLARLGEPAVVSTPSG